MENPLKRNSPHRMERISALVIFCVIASGLLGVAILIVLFASPRVVQAQLPQPVPRPQPPPRPVLPLGWQPGTQPAAPPPSLAPAARAPAVTSGVWTPLNDQPYLQAPAFSPQSAFLLTDGTVLAQNGVNWWKLTPDNTGSYINGTWSQMASLHNCGGFAYSPGYYASAVLPDGRLVVVGGEENASGSPSDTNQGAIYDPVANTWTCIAPPSGWKTVGDAPSVVLPDGTFMVAQAVGSGQLATLNTSTNPPTFNSPFTPTGKSADGITDNLNLYDNNEEGWELLPNGTVLTLEIWNANDSSETPALVYNSDTQGWSSAGTAPDPLVNLNINPGSGIPYYEIGPAILRPDGTVFAEGATQFNDIYDTNTGTWTSGPMFPSVSGQQVEAMDAPATLLPDGNVLVTASPTDYAPPNSVF